MELVVAGRLNKTIAVELGISEITVMRKMRAESLTDLVRMAARFRLALPLRDQHGHPPAVRSLSY